MSKTTKKKPGADHAFAVMWETRVTALNHLAAARKAKRIQLKLTATTDKFFVVQLDGDECPAQAVDLNDK